MRRVWISFCLSELLSGSALQLAVGVTHLILHRQRDDLVIAEGSAIAYRRAFFIVLAVKRNGFAHMHLHIAQAIAGGALLLSLRTKQGLTAVDIFRPEKSGRDAVDITAAAIQQRAECAAAAGFGVHIFNAAKLRVVVAEVKSDHVVCHNLPSFLPFINIT